MNLLDLIEESRIKRLTRKPKSKYLAGGGAKSSEARGKKGKFRQFKTLGQGVDRADYGSIFSTHRSNRIYVVTRPTWGKKSHLAGKKKVYKGFSADTPVADIKGYAQRVQQKYLAGGRKIKESTYGARRVERAKQHRIKRGVQLITQDHMDNPFMHRRWETALSNSAKMSYKKTVKDGARLKSGNHNIMHRLKLKVSEGSLGKARYKRLSSLESKIRTRNHPETFIRPKTAEHAGKEVKKDIKSIHGIKNTKKKIDLKNNVKNS
jgi:hypothetical protein